MQPTLASSLAQILARAFQQPGNRDYCDADSKCFFPSNDRICHQYTQHEGMARLCWPGMVYA